MSEKKNRLQLVTELAARMGRAQEAEQVTKAQLDQFDRVFTRSTALLEAVEVTFRVQ